MTHLLDNIVWHSLVSSHARFAVGQGGARRFAPGFSPIIGFENPLAPDWAALTEFCQTGESFYTAGWSDSVPAGWNLEMASTMFQLVWRGEVSLDARVGDDAICLGPEHAESALELARLTHPGPFGVRTLELGQYFGYFEGKQLIAMAGERLHAAPFREISGVCTHPTQQGKGWARRLMTRLIRLQVSRGEIPFLHVMRENHLARGLYARMGFAEHRESVVRVISKLA